MSAIDRAPRICVEPRGAKATLAVTRLPTTTGPGFDSGATLTI
jgi:hypothetical protein